MSASTTAPEFAKSENGGKSINIQSSVKWQAYNGGRCSALQGDCACSLTRRAARSVTQLYDLVLAPTGLKATQFVLLRAIAEGELIAQWQLGRDLSIAVETLTRRLATMRREGWVELHSGSDKREHLYSITELGRQKLDAAHSYWQRAEERLHEQLGDQGWRETSAVLDRLAIAAEHSLSARMKNVARS